MTIMVIGAHFSVKMVTNCDKYNNYNQRLHIQMRLFIQTDKTIDGVLFIYFFYFDLDLELALRLDWL